MRKVLLIVLVFISVISYAQPNNYNRINMRYDWLGGYFRALTIPSGSSYGLNTNQWPGAGAVYIDTVGTDSGYYYLGVNAVWHKLAKSSDLSSGALISNLGSAYRLWKPQTPGLASLNIDNGLTPDSATSGQIGIKWGGALTANTTISGSNVRDVTFSGLDDYTMTLDRNYFITNTKSDVVAKFEFHGPESGNVISLLQQTTSGDSAAYLNANEYSIGISARQTNPVNEASLIDVFPTYINFQQNGAEGGEYRFHNMQTRASSSGWKAMAWRHTDSTIVAIDFPTAGISGSIADQQIAFGTGTSITGSSNLTWNGTNFIAQNTSATPGLFITNPSSTNSAVNVLTLRRQTSGTPATGIAGTLVFEVEGTGSTIAASTITSELTAIGGGAQTARTLFTNYRAGTPTVGLTLEGDGRLYGSALHNNSGSVTGASNQYIASGTYRPDIEVGDNIEDTTSYFCTWKRVGNVVTVSGMIGIDPSGSGTPTFFDLDLPIPTGVAANYEIHGSGSYENDGSVEMSSVFISGEPTNDRVRFSFQPISAGAEFLLSFIFQYEVIDP